MHTYYDRDKQDGTALIDLYSTQGIWLRIMIALMYLEKHSDEYYKKKYGMCECKKCDTCKIKDMLIYERGLYIKELNEKMEMIVKRDKCEIFNIK